MSHVNVFVSSMCHDNAGRFLLAKRGGNARDRHGSWEFGGGALEPDETLEQALRREAKEEFGVTLHDIKQVGMSEFQRPSGYWLGIFYIARVNPDEVYIAEPVYDEIGWFRPDELPEPMFEDARDFVKKALEII
jgi:8-oxo-dGTP diphosphatase